MGREELEKLFDNIQFQMIAEQNMGYRNEYSKPLKDKINLYNEVITLQGRIEKAQDFIRNETSLNDSEIDELSMILDGDYDD